MKRVLVLTTLLIGFWAFLSSGLARENSPIPQLSAFYGKSYQGVEDPEFISYDQLLRSHLVQRIYRRLGIRLDSKTYSGFDLLEIESLLKCRKRNEPFDLFLRMFPKSP